MKPTVGRQVHFFARRGEFADGEAHAATIVAVHSDTRVNLCVLDRAGRSIGIPSVLLVGPNSERPADESFCEWPKTIAASPSNSDVKQLLEATGNRFDDVQKQLDKLAERLDTLAKSVESKPAQEQAKSNEPSNESLSA